MRGVVTVQFAPPSALRRGGRGSDFALCLPANNYTGTRSAIPPAARTTPPLYLRAGPHQLKHLRSIVDQFYTDRIETFLITNVAVTCDASRRENGEFPVFRHAAK